MYCTIEEIFKNSKIDFLEIALSDNFTNGYEEVDEETKLEEIKKIIAGAIDDASAEINGYLLKKYPISFLKKSKAINKFCKDIALYNILSRSGNDEDNRENNYYLRYKNAIKFLENVAKGTIDLTPDDNTEVGEDIQNNRIGIKIKSSKKLFGRANLGGM
ncbi:DUF1320 domain-containing protein [[Clostridium] colinum]|uniref:DUF1320 domain-containing protein n=1 Tax=[Clostridium] colinum TaxID=36835 RepID=UPI00202598B4|nr:DUF1320 domain-containing protein [[Clostridium] colinum]